MAYADTLDRTVFRTLGDARGRIDTDLAALAFGADGNLWGVEECGTLRSWRGATLEALAAQPLSDAEDCWAFSPGAEWLAAGDGSVTVWRIEEGEPVVHEILDAEWTTALAFSADGTLLASGHADGWVRVWETESGELLAKLGGHARNVTAVAFAANSGLLASAGDDLKLLVHDWRHGITRALHGHTDRIDAVAWSHDGKRLATACWDTSVRLWNVASGELLALLNGHAECVHAVAFLPGPCGAGLLASGDSAGVVRIWDYERLAVRRELSGHGGAAKRLTASADGRRLAAGGADRVVREWNLAEPDQAPACDTPRSAVVDLLPGPDGDAIALHADHDVRRWRLADGAALPILRLRDGDVPTALARGAGDVWAFGFDDGRVELSFGIDGRLDRGWVSDHDKVHRLAFAPNGRRLVTAHWADATLRIWDSETAELQVVVPEATLGGTLEAVAFHPTLPMLAAAGIDWADGRPDRAAPRVSDWQNGSLAKQALIVRHHQPFQPDGCVVLWDTQTWRIKQTLPGGVRKLAFRPDGKALATVGLDDVVRVWHVGTGALLAELRQHEMEPEAVAFAPDGETLAVAGGDGAVWLWDCQGWMLLDTLSADARLTALAYADDAATLIVGAASGVCLAVAAEDLPAG